MLWRGFFDRLTGRDRLRESRRTLEVTRDEMDRERIARVKTMEKNARQNAENFRAVHLFDAALMEKEKAEALNLQKRSLQRRRERAEESRLAVIRGEYGMDR